MPAPRVKTYGPSARPVVAVEPQVLDGHKRLGPKATADLNRKKVVVCLTRLWPFRNRPSADQQGRAGTVRKLGEVW
jgi:hypothetical protein